MNRTVATLFASVALLAWTAPFVASPNPVVITKVGTPNTVTPGSLLTYVITVTNFSSIPQSGLTLGDALPPEVEFVEFGPTTGSNCSVSGGHVICTFPFLGPFQTITVEIRVRVRETTLPGTILNSASVSGPGGFAVAQEPTEVVPPTTPPTTGTVIIKKVTRLIAPLGPFGPVSFSFETTLPARFGGGTFSVRDGEMELFEEVEPGRYTVTEDDPRGNGFDFTDVTCQEDKGADSEGDKEKQTATINVEAGETVTCTFTNTQNSGTIVIGKGLTVSGAIVGNDQFEFDHSIDKPPVNPRELIDLGPFFFTLSPQLGENIIFNNLQPGLYRVSEIDPRMQPGGFEFKSIDCGEDQQMNSTVDVPNMAVHIQLELGEFVECAFRNAPLACNLDFDNDVDIKDDFTAALQRIRACFRQPASCDPGADFNADGRIDSGDIFFCANQARRY